LMMSGKDKKISPPPRLELVLQLKKFLSEHRKEIEAELTGAEESRRAALAAQLKKFLEERKRIRKKPPRFPTEEIVMPIVEAEARRRNFENALYQLMTLLDNYLSDETMRNLLMSGKNPRTAKSFGFDEAVMLLRMANYELAGCTVQILDSDALRVFLAQPCDVLLARLLTIVSGSLDGVTTFEAFGNECSSIVARLLGLSLRHMINLRRLRLAFSGTSIELDMGIRPIATSLERLDNLEYLGVTIMWGDLEDDAIEILLSAMGRLSKLSHLELNFAANNITDRGLRNISGAISKLENLKYLALNLMGNSISDYGVETLASSIAALRNLTYLELNLSHNNIDGSCGQRLADALGSLEKIIYMDLDLRGNRLSGESTSILKNLEKRSRFIRVLIT